MASATPTVEPERVAKVINMRLIMAQLLSAPSADRANIAGALEGRRVRH